MQWPTGLLFVLIMVLICTPEYLYPYLLLYYSVDSKHIKQFLMSC